MAASYASVYASRTSYQTCTVTIPLYSTVNGGTIDSDLNTDYLRAIREGRSFNVLTGFRVWPNKASKDTDAGGDAPIFSLAFKDFGIVGELPEDRVSSTSTSTSADSGAHALAAAATSFAAFLLL